MNGGTAGGRTPILLLHGALGCAEQMRDLGSRLAGDRPVLGVDLAGHGRRSNEGGAFTIARFAADISAYLDREGVERADVFGYSMGGYVALYLARHRPDRIGGIVTLGTKFAWDAAYAAREAGRIDPRILEARVPAFAGKLRSWHGRDWKNVATSTGAMMLDLGARPALIADDLESVPHRVLVAVGDRDAMVTVDETRQACESLPAGECLVLEGTPHPLDQVDPGLLAEQIREFCSNRRS